MPHQSIVTIHFRNGEVKRRFPWIALRMEKVKSLLYLTIDGRTYRFLNVSAVEVTAATRES